MRSAFSALMTYLVSHFRSYESLSTDSGFRDPQVNRLYYACFYAVSALLLTKGLTATCHDGLRTLFHQCVIRVGLLPFALG